MRDQGGLSPKAEAMLDGGVLAQQTEYFSGAELAGLVRSAASFALSRAVTGASDAGVVQDYDFHAALGEVKPALGKQDDVLKRRYPYGIVESSATSRLVREYQLPPPPHHHPATTPPPPHHHPTTTTHPPLSTTHPPPRVQRELKRFVTPTPTSTGRLQSTLLVGAGAGAGVTALAAWAAVEASEVSGWGVYCCDFLLLPIASCCSQSPARV